MIQVLPVAIGVFADLWLYSEPDCKSSKHRVRDFGATVVAAYACGECGAGAGIACRRVTANRSTVERRSPHFGRSKQGRNRPYRSSTGEKG